MASRPRRQARVSRPARRAREAVGGVPIAEAIRRTSAIISQDTFTGARQLVPFYLAMPDVLQALGLSAPRRGHSDLVRGGKRWTARVPAGKSRSLAARHRHRASYAGRLDRHRTAPLPLWLQAPLDYHRLVPLPDRHALYVTAEYGHGHRQGDAWRVSASESSIRSGCLNPRAVILDLRLDQGGNGDLRNGLIADLIRRRTTILSFLSCVAGDLLASEFILEDLDRLTDAVFIGEPASSRPISYGDAYQSKLPNSGIAVRTSIRYWQSARTPAVHPDRRRHAIQVRGLCRWSRSRVGGGAFLSFWPRPSGLARQAADRRAGCGNEAAKAYVDDPAHRYRDVQFELIMAEQRLWEKSKGRSVGGFALELGALSAQCRACDGPRLCRQRQGAKDEARKAISAALAIDPKIGRRTTSQDIIERK